MRSQLGFSDHSLCLFQFALALVILAFVGYSNANAIGYVVDIAKASHPVGTHGPALVNLWGNGGYNSGYNSGYNNNGNYNNNGWNGYSISLGDHETPSLYVTGYGPASYGSGSSFGPESGPASASYGGESHSGYEIELKFLVIYPPK